MEPTSSRGGILSAADAAAHPDAIWDADTDATMIFSCNRLVETCAEYQRLCYATEALSNPAAHPEAAGEIAALVAQWPALMREINGMRAQSFACAEAMARVTLTFAERDADWQTDEVGLSWPPLAIAEWLVGCAFADWVDTHPTLRIGPPPAPTASSRILPRIRALRSVSFKDYMR